MGDFSRKQGRLRRKMAQIRAEYERQILEKPKKKKKRKHKRWFDRPPVLKKMPKYLDYIQSKLWAEVVQWRLRIARYKCEKCGCKKRLEVHHLTYNRLGRELKEDLQVLCRDCHRGEHEWLISANSHMRSIARE